MLLPPAEQQKRGLAQGRKRTALLQIWLFSRYSTGWVCGLHADFTELCVSNCVDTAMDRKEGKAPSLPTPSSLQVSTKRDATSTRHSSGIPWPASSRSIATSTGGPRGSPRGMSATGGPPPPTSCPSASTPRLDGTASPWTSSSTVPSTSPSTGWLFLYFEPDLSRQTRMLADLTLVNCYSRTGMTAETRDRIMLESAKNNLRNLAFFGLKEKMDDSQFMYEQLFGLR